MFSYIICRLFIKLGINNEQRNEECKVHPVLQYAHFITLNYLSRDQLRAKNNAITRIVYVLWVCPELLLTHGSY